MWQRRLCCQARAAGFDVWGADTYAGKYTEWQSGVSPSAFPYVSQIIDGRLPFEDASFDQVMTNQVFEHIPQDLVAGALSEIRRVLKPGGSVLFSFPMADIWFEGHLGLYFPHRLRRFPRLQRAYLHICHRLGFGYHRGSFDSAEWADKMRRLLASNVFHHSPAEFSELCRTIFGAKPVERTADYMRFRLPKMAQTPDAILAFIGHKRSGRIYVLASS